MSQSIGPPMLGTSIGRVMGKRLGWIRTRLAAAVPIADPGLVFQL